MNRMQTHLSQPDEKLTEIPTTQRRPAARPIDSYFQTHCDRNTAIIEAYRSGEHTMKAIAGHVGLHYSQVSRIINHTTKKAQERPHSL